jgi:ferredoxin--NADP+ reductase
MFEVVNKKILSETIKEIDILAPNIAKNAKPGQFVVLRIDEFGERIPLTIVSADKKAQTVKIIFQEVGKSTKKLGLLEKGSFILDFLGPLGIPSLTKKYGNVICIGGGVGIAAIYPIAKELKSIGNKVTSIIGVRTKDMIMLQNEMEEISDEIFFTSNDGTLGTKGFVTDILKNIIKNEKIDMIFAVGPIVMMKAVFDLVKQHNIPLRLSLESLMVDGIGMCGACRVNYEEHIKFSCIDGPEFDAYKLDFQDIMNRQKAYCSQEKKALDEWGNS